MSAILCGGDEHIEYLDGGELRLIVSDRHTFGTDALLLASFSQVRRGMKVCDFGTGCGIIPFWWLRSCAPEEIYAVEIQSDACEQLRRSCVLSPKAACIRVIENDLRCLGNEIRPGSLDVITMNPPYTPSARGLLCGEKEHRIARSETFGTFDEICLAAARLLKFGGSFCVCLRPERLTDAMAAMREAKLEPKRLRFVAKKAESAPWLFLLEGKRGRNPGLTVQPVFSMQNSDGTDSGELLEVLGTYRKTAIQPERK